MICVTLGESTHDQLVAEHRRLAGHGVPLVELRLDCLTEPIDLTRLLPRRPGPVIVTLRRPEDGGHWRGDESDRRALLAAASEVGVEYVDLEPDAARALPRTGSTQRVVSLHDFSGTPADLGSLHAGLAACDADVVKLATKANSPDDCLRMLNLVRGSTVPTVGLCMGDIGTPTRVLAGRLGAPWTYCAADGQRQPLAPGQISFQQMRDLYRYDQITAATQLYGVIGDPVGHSQSPLIHNRALEHLQLDGLYLPFRVPPEHLDAFLAAAADGWGLRGLSVTIPHKEAALRHVTQLEPPAQGLGAVNTLVFNQGEVLGANTDVAGSIDSLRRGMGPERFDAACRRQAGALVLGAGGAAKAVAWGLVDAGLQVTIAGRTIERARRLAAALGCQACEWNNRHEALADIVVNCTPLGMYPKVDASPLEPDALAPRLTVFDTVYNPEETQLIRQARQRGCTVVTGIEMFIGQAAAQFVRFTGHPAPVDVMRAALRGALGTNAVNR